MYGAINYLPDEDGITRALECFHKHTSSGGILVVDCRWAKNQPKGVLVEERSDGMHIVKEWVHKDNNTDSMHALYKVAFFRKGKDGVLMYEEHSQNFSDPFYLKSKMEKVGFERIKVYDNFDFTKEVRENDAVWRTVILARKD
jgi:hypothetical protein